MAATASASTQRDVFISHASEDKDEIARPLADELIRRGLRVWFDEYELVLGDSLRQRIDEGLAKSTIGIVILSHHFFAKPWPQLELDGLNSRLMGGEANVIVPIWHELTEQDLLEYSPPLAGMLAGRSALGVQRLADEIERVLIRHGRLVRATNVEIPQAPRRKRERFRHSVKERRHPNAVGETRVNRSSTEVAPAAIPKSPEDPVSALDRAWRAIASLAESDGDGLITLAVGGRAIVLIAKRPDGVMSIQSDLLNPRQRVLAPEAEALLRELAASALARLTVRDLERLEVHLQPSAEVEPPTRPRISEEQRRIGEVVARALMRPCQPRVITLTGTHGIVRLNKLLDRVTVAVGPAWRPVQESTFDTLDASASAEILAGVASISDPRDERIGVEDEFLLPGRLSYSKLRMLVEELIVADGRFALLQEHPVERAVLVVRKSRQGRLVLELPGSIPSAQTFHVAGLFALVEKLEAAVPRLVASHRESLRVRATWPVAALTV